MIYVIALQIEPKRDITLLIEEIKKSAGWSHHIDNTWMVATEETAKKLYERLAVYLQPTDYILIIELSSNASYYGFLPNKVWKWITDTRNLGY